MRKEYEIVKTKEERKQRRKATKEERKQRRKARRRFLVVGLPAIVTILKGTRKDFKGDNGELVAKKIRKAKSKKRRKKAVKE